MSAALMSLLLLESVLTAAAVVMFAYRSVLDLKEEDHLILDEAEAHLASGQASIRHKATMLDRYLKFVTIAWLVLGVVIFAVWVAEGLGLV